MAENEDRLGTYEIPTHNKPIDENTINRIYLSLFDNGENIKQSCRFKVVLSFLDEDGNRKEFIAPILNQFEPGRWLRSVDEKHRENPFYRQAIEFKDEIKKTIDGKFHKKFSAGFFYDTDIGHRNPNNGAYAYMIWVDGMEPMVGFRFFDYSIDATEMPLNEYLKGRGPKWSLVLRQDIGKNGMIDAW